MSGGTRKHGFWFWAAVAVGVWAVAMFTWAFVAQVVSAT